jgi:hypothetical protein
MITEGLPDIIIGKPSFQFDDAAAGASRSACSCRANDRAARGVISRDLAHRLSSGLGLEAVRPRRALRRKSDRRRSRPRVALGLTTQDVAMTVAA